MNYEYQRKDQNLSFLEAVEKLKTKYDVKVVNYLNHMHPARINCIKDRLRDKGLDVQSIKLSKNEYDKYIHDAKYDAEYYKYNLLEKSLEHFICYKLLNISKNDFLVDIACEISPLCEIMQRLIGCKGYMQDLMFPVGINGNRIGGDAANLPVSDDFFSGASVTCSLEHFEGDADIRFMTEMARVLKPGGKVVIAPLYIYPTACYLTDPVMAVVGEVPFDEPVFCIENWGNRHARFYSPETLYERLIKPNPSIKFEILLLENSDDFGDPTHCYCRFILVGAKNETVEAHPRRKLQVLRLRINEIWASKRRGYGMENEYQEKDILPSNISNSIKIAFGDNWHAPEFWGGDIPTRWISNDAILHIFSMDRPLHKMLFKIRSFYKPLRLQVYLNEDIVLEKEISTNFIKIVIPLKLKQNKNIIRFHSVNGSDRPIDIPASNSTDIRHLSFAFQDLQLSIFDTSKFDYHKYPLKINLGCGFDKRAGYLNVDFQEFHKPDLVADVRNLFMLPSDTYEEILAQDVLEHLPRIDIESTLEEWYRLLRVGGVLKLRIPNLIGLLHLLEDKRYAGDQEDLIKCLFGTQAYNGDYHLSGFTGTLIEHYLKEARFAEISLSPKDQWLFEIKAKK